MKYLPILLSLTFLASCSVSKLNYKANGKLEILKVDSTIEHYVFTIKSKDNPQIIVIAEKRKVKGCKPFKRFIIKDSIEEVASVKAFNSYDMVGFNGYSIDGVKMKNRGELTKIISSCAAFTDK